MSSPARDARLLAIARGFTQVIGRGYSHIVTRNPTTGKCAFDGQVGGGWHYGAGLETDTAWEQDAVQAYLKMVKAGYNLRARKLFNGGDLIQWTDPGSGQWVKFQPVNFQWIDAVTGSNSIISVAQAISAPTVDDDKLYWPAAFGAGRHFRYTAAPTKLIKHLIIDSAANLPACPAWITNPWLELTFTLTPSSGVTMYVDGQAWNQATAKTTANAIEFRLPSGEVVWSMAAPLAYDSSEMGEPCNGQIKLYVNKKVKYASVRFPKAWIDSAVFPIVLDPEIEYEVVSDADSGFWTSFGGFASGSSLYVGYGSNRSYSSWVSWDGVTIPAGATIDTAYISLYLSENPSVVGTPLSKIYFNDSDSPVCPTDAADADGKTKTTAYVSWSPTGSQWSYATSPDLADGMQELVDSYDFSSGLSVMVLILGEGSGNNYARLEGYYYGSKPAILHIEYTEAAGGSSWAGTWGG